MLRADRAPLLTSDKAACVFSNPENKPGACRDLLPLRSGVVAGRIEFFTLHRDVHFGADDHCSMSVWMIMTPAFVGGSAVIGGGESSVAGNVRVATELGNRCRCLLRHG